MQITTRVIKNMSKKNERSYRAEQIQDQRPTNETVQNTAPIIGWPNFDVFWSMCVKGGTPTVKSACIAHLKSIGAWEDQSKWIDGLKHYGVPVEK